MGGCHTLARMRSTTAANGGDMRLRKRGVRRPHVLFVAMILCLFVSLQSTVLAAGAAATVNAVFDAGTRTITCTGQGFAPSALVSFDTTIGKFQTTTDASGVFVVQMPVPADFSGRVTIQSRSKRVGTAPTTPTTPAVPSAPATPTTPGASTAPTAPVTPAVPATPATGSSQVGSTSSQGQTYWTATTFYTYWDNDPVGTKRVSDPIVHNDAGGKGTYADPITAAVPRDGANMIFKPGTIFYLPDMQKYFVAEDWCTNCTTTTEGGVWVDFWNDDSTVAEPSQAVGDCSLKFPEYMNMIVNPAPNLPVVEGSLFEGGKCYADVMGSASPRAR